MSGIPSLAAALAATALSAVCAIADHRTGRIPNALTVPGLLLGLALGALGGGVAGAVASLCGAALAAIVPALLNRAGALGGGDLKLFAALGALAGPRLGLEIETAAFLFGAAHGLVAWGRAGCLGGGLRAAAGLVVPFAGARLRRGAGALEAAGTTIRLGPSIALGTAAALGLELLGRAA